MNKIVFYVGLLILVLVLRLLPIWPNYFAFMFDHAKDSLVIREMGQYKKPALLGPAASIEGVFLGPFWYYLALPLNWLTDYHPLASVITLDLLFGLLVVLAYIKLGLTSAIFLATAIGLIGTQQSAWTPYMTSLLTLLWLLIILKFQLKSQVNSTWFVLLALILALYFHFQPALGVVILPITLLILFWLKLRINFRQWLLFVLAFSWPFVFHLIFELRHDFFQTKNLIVFFQNYGQRAATLGENQVGWRRFIEIGQYLLNSGQIAWPVNFIGGGWLALALILFYLFDWRQQSNKTKTVERIIFINLIFGSWVLYQIIPCKNYYLTGLIPVWTVFLAKFVDRYLLKFRKIILSLVLIFSLVNLLTSFIENRLLVQTQNFSLAAKMAAVNKVYELAAGRPFASYQFVPEIYDYTYQFLFARQIAAGRPAAVEISYAPGESNYKIGTPLSARVDKPDYIFLIVEQYKYKQFFDSWWQRVANNLTIVQVMPINQAITIYQTIPNDQTL